MVNAVQDIISKAEFARRAGVSRAAVTKASLTALSAAIVAKRIDAAHPDAVAYIQSKQGAAASQQVKQLDPGSPTGYRGRTEQRKRESAAADPSPAQTEHPIPEHIEAFADMTLRQVVTKFGTDYRFVDWLKALQIIESIQEKQLKNAEKRGDLISRDLVRMAVIEPVDTAMQKLLTDGAKTIAKRVAAMIAAGRTEIEVQDLIEDQLSSFIKPMKAKMVRNLKRHTADATNADAG